jgi:hypothetical protein
MLQIKLIQRFLTLIGEPKPVTYIVRATCRPRWAESINIEGILAPTPPVNAPITKSRARGAWVRLKAGELIP